MATQSKKLKTIKELAPLTGKRVLFKVDYNCPVDDGKVGDNYRIEKTMPTFRYLLENGVRKITIMTHLGRPKGEFKEDSTLKPIVEEFKKVLNEAAAEKAENGKNWLKLVNDLPVELIPYNEDLALCVKEINEKEEGIFFLENIRFWKAEESKDEAELEAFADKMAKAGDIYVNDAFGVSHRAHASVVAITEKLPSAAGLLMEEELKKIGNAVEDPVKPAVAVVGGAKLETKIAVLETLSKNYDKVLVGGLIAVELQDEKNKELLAKLPAEKMVLPEGYEDPQKRDIDAATIEKFTKEINQAKTILWNGPMGKFEEAPFDKGTKQVAEAIANSGALVLTGGGETHEVLKKFDLEDKIDFISTGGGAMLDVIVGKELPGVGALRE